jgi:hypothetical protein
MSQNSFIAIMACLGCCLSISCLISLYNLRQNVNTIENKLHHLKNQNLDALKDIVTDILSHELEEMSNKDEIFEKKLQETIDVIYVRLDTVEKRLPIIKDRESVKYDKNSTEKKIIPPSTPRRGRRGTKTLPKPKQSADEPKT